jgi:hypothetical protein
VLTATQELAPGSIRGGSPIQAGDIAVLDVSIARLARSRAGGTSSGSREALALRLKLTPSTRSRHCRRGDLALARTDLDTVPTTLGDRLRAFEAGVQGLSRRVSVAPTRSLTTGSASDTRVKGTRLSWRSTVTPLFFRDRAACGRAAPSAARLRAELDASRARVRLGRAAFGRAPEAGGSPVPGSDSLMRTSARPASISPLSLRAAVVRADPRHVPNTSMPFWAAWRRSTSTPVPHYR